MAFKSVWGFDPVEALDYDFDLGKLERVMSGAVKLPHFKAKADPQRRMVDENPCADVIERDERVGKESPPIREALICRRRKARRSERWC
jgi:hypothetical protein